LFFEQAVETPMSLFSNWQISNEFGEVIRTESMSTAGLTESLPMDSSSQIAGTRRVAI
jgi:hypothetical protein